MVSLEDFLKPAQQGFQDTSKFVQERFANRRKIVYNGREIDPLRFSGVAGSVGGVASSLPKLATLFAAGVTASAITPTISEKVKTAQLTYFPQKGIDPNRFRQFAESRDAEDIGRITQSGFARGVDMIAERQGIPVSRIQDILPTRSIRQDVLNEGFRAAQSELLKRGYSQSDATRLANYSVQLEAARESGALGFTLSPEALANVSASVIAKGVLPKVVGPGGRIVAEGAERLAPSFIQRSFFQLPGASRLRFLQSETATAAGRIAGRAGVIEGTSSVLAEDVSRRQFGQQQEGITSGLLGQEKGSLGARALSQTERTLIGGLAGAVVAKPLGFLIGGQFIPRPKVSKLYEITGQIIDIPELPGDVLTNWAARRLKVSPNRVRVLAVQPSSSNPLTGESTPGSAAIAVVPSESESFVSAKAQVQLDDIFAGLGGQTPAPPPNQIAPPPTPGDVTPSQITEDIVSQDDVPPPTNVPTSVSDIFSEVPTKSNIFRGGIPPLPFLGPPPSGYRGGKIYKRSKFINELDLLRRLVGSNLGVPRVGKNRKVQAPKTQIQLINDARKQVRRALRKNTSTKPLTPEEKERYYQLTGVRL